jgi:hypothetical protein
MNISQNIFLSLKPPVLIETKLQVKTLKANTLDKLQKINPIFGGHFLNLGFQ